jgi:hypothetical protein
MEADADVTASFRHLSGRPREIEAVKFVAERPLADPDAAVRKLVEIANAPSQCRTAGSTSSCFNAAFLNAGGTPDQFRAGLARAVAVGWLWRHESGTYVKFTAAGAELFA